MTTRSGRAVASAGQEAQADGSHHVVRVGVQQADGLPRPEGQPSAKDGDRERGRRKERDDVVGTVPWGAVAVAIQAILSREQSVQGVHQVVVGARADLQDDQAGRGVRHEDGQQAVVPAGDVREVRAAGAEYPQWINARYLQLPEAYSPRIKALAEEITATAETPYDKALAITRYLRENIEYVSTIPSVPNNKDPLEWILFEYKKGYCVYYATSEIVMLRSIGIPARMAVGFAQGTGTSQGSIDENVENVVANSYTVRKNNAHAWPEVYFPNVGWVEFEPTGNQAPLDRPIAPREDLDSTNGLNPGNLPIPESNLDKLPLDDGLNNDPTTADSTFFPLLYLLPLFIAFAALTIYLSRRYALTVRIPAFVRTTMERSGLEVPNWILNWERWSSLSPIERSFESINFGLRQVNQPAPVHATPLERAKSLANILPQLEIVIKVLLDEHQTSLYTSRVADERQARRAALQIRTQVVMSLIRYFWTGTYETTVAKIK